MKKIIKTQKTLKIIQIILMIYWISAIKETDSYYITYLVTGILGFIAFYMNNFNSKEKISKRDMVISIGCGTLYSITVVLSNYGIFSSWISIVLVGIGAFSTIYNIIKCIITNPITIKKAENSNKTITLFTICTLIIFVFNCVFLIFVYYPGILTPDSINQITQIKTEKYSNHHPFYHTMLIKIWVDVGNRIFNNINIGVMLYNLFQILIIALSIAYCLTTLYQKKVSKKYIATCMIFYLLMPYNIMYSFTVWKDILFACSVLTFITALYRIINKIGKNQVLNYILILISGIVFMLFRSNGMIAFVAFFFVLLIILKQEKKTLIGIMFVAICLSIILKGPVLKTMNVSSPDMVESLSIPVQQVARVVTEEKELTKEQYELLSKIIKVENIQNKYKNYISDPIKWEIRNYGNQQYLKDNKIEYLKLYLSLGIKYPKEYIKAWIDQTKGYWNGGYKYWIWSNGVTKNELGIERKVNSKVLQNFTNKYLELYDKESILSLFVSIGFNTWILIIVFLYDIAKKKKEALLALPILFLIGTLIIATPVYSEFRYIYSLFLCLPFIILCSFNNSETTQEK